jgi:hypothetical protein
VKIVCRHELGSWAGDGQFGIEEQALKDLRGT